jgi:hypothetical protein
MPLPEDLRGDKWTPKIARAAFPWLIWAAKNRRTLFYSDLDAEIVRRGIHRSAMALAYRYPAGAVGNAILEVAGTLRKEVPPLNALIVAKTGKEAGLPGDGCDWYLQKFLDREVKTADLSVEDKRAIISEVHEAIFEFDGWDDIQAYFSDVVRRYPELAPFDGNFLSIKAKPMPAPNSLADAVPWDFVPPPVFQQPRTPESPDHRALKQYIAAHPEIVGLPKGALAILEKVFGSGDRADVVFTDGDRVTAVEVKSALSPLADLTRGVFQCVKYKAVIRAHQKLKRVIPNGDAILVTGKKLPPSIVDLASQLGVKWIDGVVPR